MGPENLKKVQEEWEATGGPKIESELVTWKDRRAAWTEGDKDKLGWLAVPCAKQEEKAFEMCPYLQKIFLERVSRNSRLHLPVRKRTLSQAKRTQPRGSDYSSRTTSEDFSNFHVN